MASNLTWLQAFVLGTKAGRSVRRDAWRRWIYHDSALWFSYYVDDSGENLHVVWQSEVTAQDLMASDWTDEPWANSTLFPPGISATPIPQGDVPGVSATAGGSTLAFDGTGTNGDATNPPAANSLLGLTIIGGLISGGSTRQTIPVYHPPNNPPVSNPVVTVTINTPSAAELDPDFDDIHSCYAGGNTAPRTLSKVTVNVSIAGGPNGLFPLHVSVPGASGSPAPAENGFKGMSKPFVFGALSYQPGSQISASAQYTVNGVTYTGTGTYRFPFWCGEVGTPHIVASMTWDASALDCHIAIDGTGVRPYGYTLAIPAIPGVNGGTNPALTQSGTVTLPGTVDLTPSMVWGAPGHPVDPPFSPTFTLHYGTGDIVLHWTMADMFGHVTNEGGASYP